MLAVSEELENERLDCGHLAAGQHQRLEAHVPIMHGHRRDGVDDKRDCEVPLEQVERGLLDADVRLTPVQ